MDAPDWLAYFQQNRLDRRGIAWHEGINLPATLRDPVTRLLTRLWVCKIRSISRLRIHVSQMGRTASETFALLLAEETYHCDLLTRVLEVDRPPRLPRLAPNSTCAAQCVAAGVIALKIWILIRQRTDSPVLRTVCEQILHDEKFQLRFWCDELHEHLRAKSRARRLAAHLLLHARYLSDFLLTIARSRREFAALGCSVSELWTTSRDNFATAQRAILFGNEQSDRGVRRHFWPRDMRVPPHLNPVQQTTAPKPRYALLINPFYPKDPHASFGKHVLTPSLALTSIAGATPPGWEVSYWDENLLQGPPPVDPFPQVVGITVHLTFAKRAFALARWYRQRGATVVLGGLHVLSCPDECAPHADALAIGDGVQTWPQILRDVEAGRLQPIYHGSYRQPYRDDPPPQRELLPRWGFLTTASLIATRGCHNRCGFCYLSTEGLHMPYLTRDVEQVVQEFLATDQPYAVFIDNNLGSRPDYLRKLCRALQPLEKIWSAAVTIDVTDDPSLVREMALAGCTGVFIGFESLQHENLADAHKRTPRTDDYARRVHILHDHGIQVNSSFVLGFDHDHKDVFAQTVQWIEQNRLECATFHILTPYPATPLFKRMEAEGRLLHRNWDLYDTAHAVFRPRHMMPEELEAGYEWCYEHLFSHQSIWRRRPADPRAVPPYLMMSYLYKRSNWFWHWLIRHRLTATVWRPIVEYTRHRHVHYRRQLAQTGEENAPTRAGTVVTAGV